jgi:putative ABC transport system substrate-binding protein
MVFLFMVAPLGAATLTVVYPKTKTANDEIFDQIIKGIQKEFKGKVNLVELAKKKTKEEAAADIATAAAAIDKQKPDMVITLANSGRKVGKLFKEKTPWVSGALPIRPTNRYRLSGISSVASPEVMFTHLLKLAPEISHVHVVYSRKSKWVIELAKVTAAKMGLKLTAHPVKNRKDAIIKYTQLLKTADHKKEAFWLPYDSISVDDYLVLPLMLEKAWEKKLVVFSSNPPHARRGALFTVYPDNETTGVNLVRMVQNMFSKSMEAGVIPTAEVKLAVNLKTASHLGLVFTTKEKGRFHLTFPSR